MHNGRILPRRINNDAAKEDALMDLQIVLNNLQDTFHVIDDPDRWAPYYNLTDGQSLNVAYKLLGLTSLMPDF